MVVLVSITVSLYGCIGGDHCVRLGVGRIRVDLLCKIFEN